MKIGFDAKRYFFNHRGLGNYSRDLIRILSQHNEQKDQLFLFSPKDPKGKSLFSPPDQVMTISPSWFWKPLSSLWRIQHAPSIAAKMGIDIYHGLSNELPFGIEKTKISSVVTIHDVICYRFPHLYDPIYRKVLQRKYEYAVRVANTVVAISEQTKADIVEFLKVDEQKIKVIYQGCNPLFGENFSAEQIAAVKQKYHLPETFLLSVGAVEERKNQLLILEALHQSKLDIPLVIVGGWREYIFTLQEYIGRNKMEKQVIFLKNVTNEELPLIYRSASLFVYPALFEGFGIPILEALYSDLPVITSKGGCFAETGGTGTLYADPYNAEELAERISQAIASPQQQEQMIEKGRQHRILFSDTTIAHNWQTLYRNLL